MKKLEMKVETNKVTEDTECVLYRDGKMVVTINFHHMLGHEVVTLTSRLIHYHTSKRTEVPYPDNTYQSVEQHLFWIENHD